ASSPRSGSGTGRRARRPRRNGSRRRPRWHRPEARGALMADRWKWASVRRIREAAEELKALIRARYPEAQFRLAPSPYDRDAWNLWTYVEIEDLDEVN